MVNQSKEMNDSFINMKTSQYLTRTISIPHRTLGADGDETVVDILKGLCCKPGEYILLRWNWKAALLSSMVRASIFFAINFAFGYSAAIAAMIREFAFRVVAAGFYGGIIESFRNAKPRWVATVTVIVVLPLINHGAEFLLHWLLGTPNLNASMMASVGLTVFSTGFNLFAMRRGVFITRQKNQTLLSDLKLMPGLFISYCSSICRSSGNILAFLSDLFRYIECISPFTFKRITRTVSLVSHPSYKISGKDEDSLPA